MWIGIAVAVVFGWLALRLFAGYPKRKRRYRVLNRAEAALLDSVAEAMFPPGGHIESSGLDADLPDYVDRWSILKIRRAVQFINISLLRLFT